MNIYWKKKDREIGTYYHSCNIVNWSPNLKLNTFPGNVKVVLVKSNKNQEKNTNFFLMKMVN